MFVQLSKEDCQYLLNLINGIDDQPAFARQRGYTIPKLQKITKDPTSARLAYQDTEYLLDLIEDSGDMEDETFPEYMQACMTQNALLEIQRLQSQRFEEQQSIEKQREMRRLRRRPTEELQKHFQQVSV